MKGRVNMNTKRQKHVNNKKTHTKESDMLRMFFYFILLTSTGEGKKKKHTYFS